jgi:hypothetical protein
MRGLVGVPPVRNEPEGASRRFCRGDLLDALLLRRALATCYPSPRFHVPLTGLGDPYLRVEADGERLPVAMKPIVVTPRLSSSRRNPQVQAALVDELVGFLSRSRLAGLGV